MPRGKFTTVSLRRETYEQGARWMAEHGYTSWDALIRGIISGHYASGNPLFQIDLGPVMKRFAHLEQTIKDMPKPNPEPDLGELREMPERLRKLERNVNSLVQLEALKEVGPILKEHPEWLSVGKALPPGDAPPRRRRP